MPNPRPDQPQQPHQPGDLSHLTNGRKVIVSALSGGLLTPNDANGNRHIAQAWRNDYNKVGGYYTWEFTRVNEGVYTIKNSDSGRYLEPKRNNETQGGYTLGWKSDVYLESGDLTSAKREWSIERRGDLYQIRLKGETWSMGLKDRNADDSHIGLLEPWWTVDRLWYITDRP
jgi:hypothetical protein